MITFRRPEEVPADFGPSVVAIGKFDGVHAGHRAIIEKLKAAAQDAGARPVVVTFDRNPLALLRPDLCPPSVVSAERKLALLGELGIDATLILTFDEERAQQAPDDFVRSVLVDAFHAVSVMVGADFRYGRGGAGNPETLRVQGQREGFSVQVIDEVLLPDSDRRVSSTLVRELLAAGDVDGAAQALGRYPTVRAEVVHGLKRGRELGFPTANLAPTIDALAPADGVYAGWMHDHDTGIRHPVAISVGTNPHFDDVVERQVEAHVLDETGLDLYGHDVMVEFTHRLRGMTAFTTLDALVEQIDRDVTAARELLRPESSAG